MHTLTSDKNIAPGKLRQKFARRYAICIMIFSIFFLGCLLSFFAYNLNTGSSDYSANGVMQTLQLFYNIFNERSFQTSIYATEKELGFHNPYAYLHNFAIHVNFVPMLLSPIWRIWPSITWLYGLFFLVNYVSISIFTWFTLKYLSPHTFKIKASLALGLVFCSGFFFTFEQNAQFLLLCSPFIYAACYFLITRKLLPFIASLMLLSLVSEDAAMVSVTFSLYVFLFERNAKRFAYVGGLLSCVYLFLVLFVIQPAARAELEVTNSTTTAIVISHILNFKFDIAFITLGFAPFLFFLPAFFIAYLLFGKTEASWVKLSGLIFLAPLPHWGECAIVGATHHLMPVIAFTYVAFVIALGRTSDIFSNVTTISNKKVFYVYALTVFFLIGSIRLLGSNLPDSVLPPIYRLVGKLEKAERIEQRFADIEVNQRVIKLVSQIPKEKSLVFLTNISIGGFVANRSNVWQFPDMFGETDYLLLQTEAAIFDNRLLSIPTDNLFIKEWFNKGKLLEVDSKRLPKEWLNLLIEHLVKKEKSYRIMVDEPGVVLLERINMNPIYIPPSTLGFGWLDNVGRKPFIMRLENAKGTSN